MLFVKSFATRLFLLALALFLFVPLNQVEATEQPFSEWLAELYVEASKKGIRKEILASALDGVKLIPRVVELDRKVGEAIDIYVNNRLVARGEVVVLDDRLGITMTEIVKTGQTKAN